MEQIVAGECFWGELQAWNKSGKKLQEAGRCRVLLTAGAADCEMTYVIVLR